jgi:acyl-CoA thioester hydrolase
VIEHKAPLVDGDTVTIRTWMEPSAAAKIILHYELKNKASGQVVATAETVQVFLGHDRKLVLDLPEFYRAWKAKYEEQA